MMKKQHTKVSYSGKKVKKILEENKDLINESYISIQEFLRYDNYSVPGVECRVPNFNDATFEEFFKETLKHVIILHMIMKFSSTVSNLNKTIKISKPDSESDSFKSVENVSENMEKLIAKLIKDCS